MKKLLALALLFFIGSMASCIVSTDDGLDAQQAAKVTDRVKQMAGSIAQDISKDGPAAWLKYFDNTPAFFMASDGQLAFADHNAAEQFINGTLVKTITHINLKWGEVRVDPLTEQMGLMACTFHEDLTDVQGKTTPCNGYFTAIAQETKDGWKLRDAHWSIKH